MCGGRGTRLDAEREKPLFEVGGVPMVERVADALADSRVDTTYAVVSPHAPATREYAAARDSLGVVETPGEGYVADLQVALETVDQPVFTVAADLPLLAGDAVDDVLDAFDGGSLTVCVPAALKRALGASADTTFEPDGDGRGRELAPTGANVVADADRDTMYTTYDARFAVNVNRRSDAELAAELLSDSPPREPGGDDGPR
ncbi:MULTISPECIES: NTP transferase domain-containing protein [Halorussus]|uniref:NTP transferase domain-containing protein n=1 Tax=Halorussus TaxID=1070314 RepID=UPI00209E7736|nr:NTP transferase domain-containing protein [Halorussus vallis]USZ77724.1 NTP transferase domain-containing protein [Halorussus vallis]